MEKILEEHYKNARVYFWKELDCNIACKKIEYSKAVKYAYCREQVYIEEKINELEEITK